MVPDEVVHITLGKEKENVGFPRNPFDRLSLGARLTTVEGTFDIHVIRYLVHILFTDRLTELHTRFFFFFLLASNLFTVGAERCV